MRRIVAERRKGICARGLSWGGAVVRSSKCGGIGRTHLWCSAEQTSLKISWSAALPYQYSVRHCPSHGINGPTGLASSGRIGVSRIIFSMGCSLDLPFYPSHTRPFHHFLPNHSLFGTVCLNTSPLHPPWPSFG